MNQVQILYKSIQIHVAINVILMLYSGYNLSSATSVVWCCGDTVLYMILSFMNNWARPGIYKPAAEGCVIVQRNLRNLV